MPKKELGQHWLTDRLTLEAIVDCALPFAQGQTLSNCSVEVGAGTALFSVELATRYTARQYIALDVKADRLQRGARLALERGLTNIWFVRARADQLPDVVPEHSVSELWLTFSDPFPIS